MRKKLNVEITRPQIGLIQDLVFSQPDFWFGNSARSLKLNLMKPRGNTPLPVIVWVCGGAWHMLDKNYHAPEMTYLAEAGFAVASVEYRTTNEAQFPAALEDVKAAIRFLRANAKRFSLDPDHIGIMGESAGAYLSVMAGVTGNIREFDVGENPEYSSAVQAVCDWYGPTDFMDFGKENRFSPASPEALLLGGPADLVSKVTRAATPATYLSQETPPMLLIHGNQDGTVPFRQSEIFYEQLLANGTPVEFYELEGADHADRHFVQPQIREIILDFFNRTLK